MNSSQSKTSFSNSKKLASISRRLENLQNSHNRIKLQAKTSKFVRNTSSPPTSGSRRTDEIEICDQIGGNPGPSGTENRSEMDLRDQKNAELLQENERLKVDLAKAQDTAQKIFMESSKLRSERLKAQETKSEVSLYKEQVETLRNLMAEQSRQHQAELKALMQELERSAVAENSRKLKNRGDQQVSPERNENASQIRTPQIRNQALTGRLKEVQDENLELRRRLAGLTPEATPGGDSTGRKRRHLPTGGDQELELERTKMCNGCNQLKKQKTRQADYFRAKLLESRQAAKENREKCEELAEEIESLRDVISRIQDIFSNKLENLEERVGLYKDRSKRSDRYNSAHLKGIQTDVKLVKKQVGNMEKRIVKTQLESIDRDQKEVINEELGRLMVRSKGAENKLRALQRSLGILEAMKV